MAGGISGSAHDAEHYQTERDREIRETVELPEVETKEVADVFRDYGLPEATVKTVADAICSDQKRWVDFMMRFELGMEEPDPRRARNSAITIAVSYVVGGMVPLAPYFLIRSIHSALLGSVLVTLVALFVFGYIKGRYTTNHPLRPPYKPFSWAALQQHSRSQAR